MHLRALYLTICRHILRMAFFFTVSVWCTFLHNVFTCEMNLNSVLPYTLLFPLFEHQAEDVVTLGNGRI
jgi:hypothetical protein